jgi:rubrerythrin
MIFFILKVNRMGSKTRKNLEKLFAKESAAAARAEIFALKAEKEGLSHFCALFRAVNESKSVHARRFLRLIRGTIGSTEENLISFAS